MMAENEQADRIAGPRAAGSVTRQGCSRRSRATHRRTRRSRSNPTRTPRAYSTRPRRCRFQRSSSAPESLAEAC